MKHLELAPYLDAQRQWTERYGGYVAEARRWRLIGLFAVAIGSASVGYALWLSGQSRIVPYVVEVNRFGRVQGGGFAQEQPFDRERVVRGALADFVINFRSVTADGRVQKDRIDDLYAFISRSDPALVKMNAHFRDDARNPFEVARERTVSVRINAITKLSDQALQVQWSEFDYDRGGKEIARRELQGSFFWTMIPPSTEKMLLDNPIGFFVTDFDVVEVTT